MFAYSMDHAKVPTQWMVKCSVHANLVGPCAVFQPDRQKTMNIDLEHILRRNQIHISSLFRIRLFENDKVVESSLHGDKTIAANVVLFEQF